MNIKLVFRESNFKLDIMEDTPCQYLYSVAQKVFRKKSSDIVLFYGKTELEIIHNYYLMLWVRMIKRIY